MTGPSRLYPSALAAVFLLTSAWSASAQSSPPLPSMPLPPSASDPAPKDSKKAQPRKAQPSRSKATNEDGSAVEAAPRRRSSNAAQGSGSSYERPTRFVPEEFDRGAEEQGSRARPFMSETGRPGMGMRF